ncbi:MAG: immune inhibitor A [Chloroflexi bacterium]|nr:immune inhibitor A [Chloroflexota bacterium]MBP8058715.1 immune inhibitor A [Chloroflexota bacterium]
MPKESSHFHHLGWGLLCLMVVLTGCTLFAVNDEPIPPLYLTPPPATAYETLAAFLNATVPDRDLVDLTRRFRGIEAPLVAQTEATTYEVGDSAMFWYKNRNSGRNEQISAQLVYRSDQLNMWVQEGERVNEASVRDAAATLETTLFPTVRGLFGHEWQPGIDGDNRVNILHLQEIGGGVVGYFAVADEYVSAVNAYSNQREMIYTSLRYAEIGSQEYFGLIAHEMQHLIQWHTDPNEEYWLDEGMGELSSHTAGYADTAGTDYEATFMAHPDIQLTNFNRADPATEPAHYGASLLFATYFRDRFGAEATLALVQHPANGFAGFGAALTQMGATITPDQLFADWLVANYLHSHDRGEGVYTYASELALPELAAAASYRRFPVSQTAAVPQYGADYLELHSDTPLTVVFTGTQQVQLVTAQPHNGDFYWGTYPADKSDMTLTRTFDLTGLTQATLTFWAWYDIEMGWDYAYIAVSQDGGQSWQPLVTASTTSDNPEGNSFGPGYTGMSGGGEAPVWVQETADLTPYVGQTVQIRFEYVTDEGVHEQGFLVDDIAIPELGYLDDVEAGDGGWNAAAFVRHSNVLPQSFLVQALLLSDTAVQIIPLVVNAQQQGQWVLPLNEQFNEAVLIIAGNTPVTTQAAAYQYHIQD